MPRSPRPHCHGPLPFLTLALPVLAAACSGGAGGAGSDGGPGALFADVTTELGLPLSTGDWPEGTYQLPEAMQGGVGVFDFDGDDRLDILHVRIPPPGDPEERISNRLYRQQPDGRFVDVTEAAGLDRPAFGQGLALGDVDNDGDPDVYIANFGPDRLYLNRGDGTFEDVTKGAGIRGNRWTTGTSFLDYDGDGDLDLYAVHYLRYDRSKRCMDPSSRREYCGPRSFGGWPDVLYRNDGDGTFTDVTAEAGIVLPDNALRGTGLGVLCADFTEDGLTDVFVANDAESNQLWVNRGDGTFSEEGILRGVAVSASGNPEASMGVTAGDIDGDGTLDLFMTHLWMENNRLYMGSRSQLYRDGSAASGLSDTDLQRTGFGCGWIDYDHDGDLDLAVANGAIRRRPRLPNAPEGWWGDYAENNQLHENDGDGGFREVVEAGGDFTREVEVGRGLAFGDLDGDGDLDMVLSNVDNSLRVYRNDAPPAGRHWLLVRALTHGRDALGARVTVRGGGREHLGLVIASTSYLSSNDPRAHFGLGALDAIDAIEVHWPDGRREEFTAAGVDRVVTVRQGEGNEL